MNSFYFFTGLVRQSFKWWRSSLYSLLPELIIKLCKPREIYISPNGNNFELKIYSSDKKIEFSSHNLEDERKLNKFIKPYKHLKINLLLPDNEFLEVVTSIPINYNNNLRSIISYKISSLSPFKKEDVFFDFKRDRNNKSIIIIRLVRNLAVQKHLDKLKKFRIFPDNLVSATFQKEKVIRLSPFYFKNAKWKNNKIFILHRLILVSFFLFIVSYFYCLETKLNKYNQLNKILLSKKNMALKVENNIEYLNNNTSQAFQMYISRPVISSALMEMSNLISNDTYFHSIQFEQNILILTGETKDASKLLEVLDRSIFFDAPRFIGPITVATNSLLEVFSLQVKINRKLQSVYTK